MLQLMQEAAEKTKQEIQTLKTIYNVNLEKIISEYNALELVKKFYFFSSLLKRTIY
jgi:hypothetical protein